jgi:hypothetical protein
MSKLVDLLFNNNKIYVPLIISFSCVSYAIIKSILGYEDTPNKRKSFSLIKYGKF